MTLRPYHSSMPLQPPATVRMLLSEARRALDTAADAEVLLSHVLGRPRSWLYAHDDARVPDVDAERFAGLLARRVDGHPVAYLVGFRGFRDFELRVTPDTLVPRHETELLVEAALQRLSTAGSGGVADLGTGSGAIAIAVARERPDRPVLATDRSDAALEVARGNAERLGVGNLRFVQGDWFVPLAGGRFEMIVSNPPYIAGDDEHLQRGDLRFEPPDALTPGGDGLDAIRTIAAGASAHLHADGWLLLEHGHDQGAAVRALLQSAGFGGVQTLRDLEARERVTLGQWRPGGKG